MKRQLFILIGASLLVLSGCKSKAPEPPPSADGKIVIQLNINEAAPPAPAPAPEPKVKKKKARRPAPPRKRQPSPPPRNAAMPSGIESDLNDVERSYVQSIRARNQQSRRANEDLVFGSFNPLKQKRSAAAPRSGN